MRRKGFRQFGTGRDEWDDIVDVRIDPGWDWHQVSRGGAVW